MIRSDEWIYDHPGCESLPRYSLFWHYSTGSVDCRILSSDNYQKLFVRWLFSTQYGIACNIR